MSCPVVLIVYFGGDPHHNEDIESLAFIKGEVKGVFGIPLWMPDGKPVYWWSIDYIVCGDQRWLVFGPFDSYEEATQAFKAIESQTQVKGYRAVAEHCYTYLFGKELTRIMNTDG